MYRSRLNLLQFLLYGDCCKRPLLSQTSSTPRSIVKNLIDGLLDQGWIYTIDSLILLATAFGAMHHRTSILVEHPRKT